MKRKTKGGLSLRGRECEASPKGDSARSNLEIASSACFPFRGGFALAVLLAMTIFLLSSFSRAQTKNPIGYEPISSYDFSGLDTKISLDIREMDIIHFLKFLAIEGNLNIVASNTVTGTVNLLINDVTIGDALEIVLSMNNLAYEVRGNIIKIITNEEYKILYGVDFYDQREIYITKLKYASATNVGAILGNVKSAIGKILYDNSTGTVILIDTPEKIDEMKEVIAKQELPTIARVLPTETRVFVLNYTKVEDISDEIEKALTADVGNMRTDTRTNTMVVTDMPHKIKEIEKMIEAFDRKTRQVFIEAKIVEATLTDLFQWGIDWDAVISVSLKRFSEVAAYSILPEITLPLGLTGDYGKVTVNTTSGQDVNVILEALSTITETKILSNPHLTVEEGKEAKIEVIERQPYQEETTTTASGGTTTTSQTFQWVDVGVILNVTPTINDEQYINMLIKPEVSSISTWYGGAAQEAGAVPVVKSADAETTITVKDGVTLIIAGLIKDEKTKTVNKIPFFGDIPIFGKLMFQNISDDIRRTETIIFLTPRIVSGEETFLLERNMAKEIKGIRK
jgi:type II secretory pathway component GspD/PulD (secretin)